MTIVVDPQLATLPSGMLMGSIVCLLKNPFSTTTQNTVLLVSRRLFHSLWNKVKKSIIVYGDAQAGNIE